MSAPLPEAPRLRENGPSAEAFPASFRAAKVPNNRPLGVQYKFGLEISGIFGYNNENNLCGALFSDAPAAGRVNLGGPFGSYMNTV